MTASTEPIRRVVPIDGEVDVRRTLGSLYLLGGDDCYGREPGVFWRATRTPEGPSTALYRTLERAEAGTRFEVLAWGPGAEWSLAQAPDLLGARDPIGDFVPPPGLRELHLKLRGLRFPASGQLVERLIPAVIGQKVTSKGASASYRALVRHLGEPAPGPFALLLPPDPARLAEVPAHELVRLNIEGKRAATLRELCFRRKRIESLAGKPIDEALRLLQVVRGIGPWTATLTVSVTHAGADVPWVGDYNLPHTVAWWLAGEERADDARMLELLEPYRPHRGRIQQMLKYSGTKAPRYGPKTDIRSLW